MFPALVISARQGVRRGLPQIGNGGDQRYQLALAVAVPAGHLVLDHPDMPGSARVQVFPGAGCPDEQFGPYR